MFFLRNVASGECQVCLTELGNDAVIHNDQDNSSGIQPSCLPIHLKCLQTWIEIQEYQLPSCPSCHRRIYIDKIETVRSAIARMLKARDFESINLLMANDQFKLEKAAFLQSRKDPDQELIKGLGNEFRDMIQEGDLESVKALLDTDLPSENNCAAALINASRVENCKIFEAILKNGKVTNEETLKVLLWSASIGLTSNLERAGLLLGETDILRVWTAVRKIRNTTYNKFMKINRFGWIS